MSIIEFLLPTMYNGVNEDLLGLSENRLYWYKQWFNRNNMQYETNHSQSSPTTYKKWVAGTFLKRLWYFLTIPVPSEHVWTLTFESAVQPPAINGRRPWPHKINEIGLTSRGMLFCVYMNWGGIHITTKYILYFILFLDNLKWGLAAETLLLKGKNTSVCSYC